MNRRTLKRIEQALHCETSVLVEGDHFEATRLLLLQGGWEQGEDLYPPDSGVRGARFTRPSSRMLELSCGDLFGVFTDLQFKPCKQAS